ncbi:hypothetical protein B0T14DRAFT_320932 [Immersiella caudata]|uniref:Uncharacterized protein n=1 Tax=Immersiella caudata TaxID=314043 RepID=A0AA39U2I2_9PEZI|nr:hypothetical protein B0T14DRAFT_320932 [Immersiella caudata]
MIASSAPRGVGWFPCLPGGDHRDGDCSSLDIDPSFSHVAATSHNLLPATHSSQQPAASFERCTFMTKLCRIQVWLQQERDASFLLLVVPIQTPSRHAARSGPLQYNLKQTWWCRQPAGPPRCSVRACVSTTNQRPGKWANLQSRLGENQVGKRSTWGLSTGDPVSGCRPSFFRWRGEMERWRVPSRSLPTNQKREGGPTQSDAARAAIPRCPASVESLFFPSFFKSGVVIGLVFF